MNPFYISVSAAFLSHSHSNSTPVNIQKCVCIFLHFKLPRLKVSMFLTAEIRSQAEQTFIFCSMT